MIKDFLTRILGKEPKQQAYTDYVVEVVDGNTLQTQNHPIALKLAGVDTPGLDTPIGQAVKDFLESYVEGNNVLVEQVSIDESGTTVAKVWFAGLNVNDDVNVYLDAQKRYKR